MSNLPKLTILIPTRNRAKLLAECLQSVVRSIDRAKQHGVTGVVVVVADNFSKDNTREVAESFRSRGDVTYHKQVDSWPTAEESLFHGLDFVESDYVWSLGDDDLATEDAVERVMTALASPFDLIILNMLMKSKGRSHTLYRMPYPSIAYAKGEDLYRDLGLIAVTAAVSSLCFRKSVLLAKVDWRLFQKTSPIYSHTLTFLLAFRDRPCAALDEPCVIYSVNEAADESRRVANVAKLAGHASFHPYSVGLITLINEAAKQSGLPISEFADFEEINLRKDILAPANNQVKWFIARMAIHQMTLTVANPSEGFSPNDFKLLDDFFVKAGDPLALRVMRCAFDALHSEHKGKNERLAQLYSLAGAVDRVEESTIWSRDNAADSWKKAFFVLGKCVPFKASRGLPANVAGLPIAPVRGEHPRLTILIPTCDRASILAQQLRNLCELGIAKLDWVEVLLADDASGEKTQRVCRWAKKKLPNLRCLRRDERLGTAEANIDQAISEAKGDYVWVLGDGDAVVQPTFSLLLNLVSYRNDPCFLFDCLPGDERPRSESFTPNEIIRQFDGSSQSEVDSPLVRGGLPDLAASNYFSSAMNLASRYVVRRSLMRTFKDYCKLSPSDAFLFGLMENLAGEKVTEVHYPLVRPEAFCNAQKIVYGSKSPHWRSFRYFPNTLGLLRQIRLAESRGVVKRNYLKTIKTSFPDGCRVSMDLEMRLSIVKQLVCYADFFNPDELPKLEEINELFDYWRTSNREGEWFDDCLYLRYLQLSRIESIYRTQKQSTRRPCDELELVKSPLFNMLDFLTQQTQPRDDRVKATWLVPVVRLIKEFTFLKRMGRRVVRCLTFVPGLRRVGDACRKAVTLERYLTVQQNLSSSGQDH
jgi:glycosyltransferase involved in cell wall biosynthesis